MGGKTSCSGNRHGIVHTVKQIHASKIEHDGTTNRQGEIDTPNPFGIRTEPWMHLCTDGTRSFGSEHFHCSAYHGRKNGNGEEHDSQTANPLGHRTPEKQSVGKNFHHIDDGGSRRGKAGDSLKIGIGEIGNIAADREGEGTKQTENDPGECYQQIGIATA